MPELSVSRINGVPYSWTSCAHLFMGLPYKGVVAANFEETREVELVHAAQQDGTPVGITSGLYKVENVSFRLLRDSAHQLMADLTAFGLGSFGDAEFNYTLQLVEPVLQVPPLLPSTTLLGGCRITGVKESQEKGVEALVTEFNVTAKYLIRTIGGVPLKLWSTARSLL